MPPFSRWFDALVQREQTKEESMRRRVLIVAVIAVAALAVASVATAALDRRHTRPGTSSAARPPGIRSFGKVATTPIDGRDGGDLTRGDEATISSSPVTVETTWQADGATTASRERRA